MVRSSGIPTRRPIGKITKVIRARSRSVTVHRPTKTTNALDETEETLSEHTEHLWVYEPRESEASEIAGERLTGSLGALVVADDTVDIAHGDRITHGGVEYEVDTIVGHPEDGDADGTESPDTDFFVVDFTRWQG